MTLRQRITKWGTYDALGIDDMPDTCYYSCPVGFSPGGGRIVLTKRNAEAALTEGKATLTFKDGLETFPFVNLYPIRVYRVERGQPDDSDAAMFLEFNDMRVLGTMTDSGSAIANLRSYCNTGSYLEGESAPMSWQELCDKVWEGVPDEWGGSPTLPYSPHGQPDGVRFDGVSATAALAAICEKISVTLVYNPFTGVLSYAKLGAAQPDPASFPDAPETARQLDESTVVQLPEKIKVYFMDNWKNYGTEKDTPIASNWLVKKPYTTEEITLTSSFKSTGTTLAIWDDLCRLYDDQDTVIASNTTARTARAQEIADNMVADAETTDRDDTYSQLLAFSLGGTNKGVVWGLTPGAYTQIKAGPGGAYVVDGSSITREPWVAPDLARNTFPNYPRLQQIVRVWEGSANEGQLIAPTATDQNGGKLFAGKSVNLRKGSFDELEDIWIQLIDDEDNDTDTQARDGEYLIGRLTGTADPSADLRPLYICRRGKDDLFRFTTNANFTHAATSITVDFIDEADLLLFSGTAFEASGHKWGYSESGASGWAEFKQDSGQFEIVWMEGMARFISFTLLGDLGSSASATVDSYWGDADNGQDPGSTTTVYDVAGIYEARETGDTGVAVWNEKLERYNIFDMKFDPGDDTTPGTTYFVQWGVLTADPAGGPPPFAVVNPVDNSDGDNPDAGGAVTVIFPLPDDHIITAEIDDVIAYALTISGEYVCVSDYSDRPELWAKAEGDWERDVGANANYVMAHPCDDKDGTGEDAGVDLKIWLPGPLSTYDAAYELIMDDQVIAYTVMSDGELVCVSDYSPKNIYLKLTTNWMSDGALPYVQGNPCHADGTSVDTDTTLFANIVGVLPAEYWSKACPNLVKDSVVAIQSDSEGLNVVVSDALDEPISAIRMIGSRGSESRTDFSATIGWQVMDGEEFPTDVRGRVPRGWDASVTTDTEVEGDAGAYDDPRDKFGDDDPANQIDDHDDHVHDLPALSGGSGANPDVAADADQNTGGVVGDPLSHAGDMRNAFFTVKYVVRVFNSQNNLPAGTKGIVVGTDVHNATDVSGEVSTVPNIDLIV